MDKVTYHFKDIIAFRTNQPQVHLLEMFAHEPYNPNDIKKEEYIGWIKSVISEDVYLIATISPMADFVCLANSEDIVRKVEEDELTEEQREGLHEFYMAPNVYLNTADDKEDGYSIYARCCHIARKAMRALYPNDEIKEVSFTESDFIKINLIDGLYQSLKNIAIDASEERKRELRDKADKLASWFETLRFKEYYTIEIGVRGDGPMPESMKEMYFQAANHYGCDISEEEIDNVGFISYYKVTIDKNFEEVSIMRNSSERSAFYLSLGPEYDLLWNAKIGFAYECIQE